MITIIEFWQSSMNARVTVSMLVAFLVIVIVAVIHDRITRRRMRRVELAVREAEREQEHKERVEAHRREIAEQQKERVRLAAEFDAKAATWVAGLPAYSPAETCEMCGIGTFLPRFVAATTAEWRRPSMDVLPRSYALMMMSQFSNVPPLGEYHPARPAHIVARCALCGFEKRYLPVGVIAEAAREAGR